jgi:hypothetical protein
VQAARWEVALVEEPGRGKRGETLPSNRGQGEERQ